MRVRKPIALILLAVAAFVLGFFNQELTRLFLNKDTYIGLLTALLALSISMTLFFHGRAEVARTSRDHYSNDAYTFQRNVERYIEHSKERLGTIETRIEMISDKQDVILSETRKHSDIGLISRVRNRSKGI